VSIEAKIGLLLKWLIAIALFLIVIMPLQIIWILLYPLIKILQRKAREKPEIDTWMPQYINLWSPIEWYGTLAEKFLKGVW